ncbi:hypothetical protein OHB26_03125 [Nocardia sp. NBC_01503]|uniref:hypothetical protein n=1 Tax=Nocardia sp. NBC_01503 TaxID=2975997 RepID=UPI002E7C41E7|nr:hypothetical protein [Nocardia sp. NBC_01503]WTL33256.1 hypothetical protein OHB26_03125 [Nocardia sp. NBC_01503]
MAQLPQPNAKLKAVMFQAGMKPTGLAKRMKDHSLTDGGSKLSTTHTLIAKWLDGTVAQPNDRSCQVMLAVLGTKLGRDLRPADIGYPDLKLPQDSPLESVSDAFENPAVISQRLQRLNQVDADDPVLDIVDFAIADILERYEVEGPKKLAPEVVSLRTQVDSCLQQRQHPKQTVRLYTLATKLSGILSYMAVNRGRFPHASMYARESFAIASLLGDPQLQAWVRGTESFCAYYMGKYDVAADLAEQGLQLATDGPQAIRLLSNGVARARGKMGDVRGVHHAIDRANALAERMNIPDGLTPALTFEPYGQARLAANAATAYLSAGDFDRTLKYGHQVETLVDESDSVWSRSLVRLDIATALIRLASPDIEQATHLGSQALTFSEERPIRSVWQRAHEFGTATESFDAPEARDYQFELRDWADRVREFSAPGAKRQ